MIRDNELYQCDQMAYGFPVLCCLLIASPSRIEQSALTAASSIKISAGAGRVVMQSGARWYRRALGFTGSGAYGGGERVGGCNAALPD